MKSMLLTLAFLAMSFNVFAGETRTDCEAMNSSRQKIVKSTKETKKTQAAVTRQ
jgi:hypothetical protein